MKVVYITYEDSGGAGDAIYLNHQLLLASNIDSKMLVKQKSRSDDSIIKFPRNIFSSILNRFLSKISSFLLIKQYLFYDVFNVKPKSIVNWLNKNISNDTDVIILGWISTFVNVSDIIDIQKRTNALVYIHAVDMALLTGGCHYSYGCENYTKECFICPAATNFIGQQEIKNRFLNDSIAIDLMGVKVFAPVEYVLNQAKKSSKPFYDYSLINIPHDFDIFHFIPKKSKEKIVFMGAYNPLDHRKGYLTFSNAISLLNHRLLNEKKTITILVPESKDCSNLVHTNVKLQTYDFANNSKSLANLYQQSDVFVSTSIDDTGPAMIIEALLCGIPVISTNTGLAQELIGKNTIFGKIAPIQNSKKIAEYIYEVLFSDDSNISPSLMIEKSVKNIYKERKSLIDMLRDDQHDK